MPHPAFDLFHALLTPASLWLLPRTHAPQKWSWSASNIGDWAELEVDTRLGLSASDRDKVRGSFRGQLAMPCTGGVARPRRLSAPTPCPRASRCAGATSCAAGALMTRAPCFLAARLFPQDRVSLYLGRLMSYKGMGLAVAECVAGCRCEVGGRMGGAGGRAGGQDWRAQA